MRLRLWALLCLLALPARAQRAATAADASLSVSALPSGAFGSVSAAPLAPLTLAVAPLTPSAPIPSAAALMPAPYAGLIAAAETPGAFAPRPLPASAIAPASPGDIARPGLPAARGEETLRALPKDASDSSWQGYFDGALERGARLDERLSPAAIEGHEERASKPLGAYLRADQPFAFSASALEAYSRARRGLDRDGSSSETQLRFLEAVRELLASAGVTTTLERKDSQTRGSYLALTVSPARGGHRLNRLAADIERTTGYSLELTAAHTGANASADPVDRTIFLPRLELIDSYESILHEARHAHFRARLGRGSLSLFHPVLRARPGSVLSPDVLSYYDYLTFEEMSTYPKTLLQLLSAADRGDARAKQAVRAHVFSLGYALDIVARNMRFLRSYASGETLATQALESGKLAAPGVRWEAVTLPDAVFMFPVREEAPAPPAPWWKRPFVSKPLTPGHKAAARYAEAMLALQKAMMEPYAALWEALEKDDYGAARKQAAKLVALAAAADKEFAAGL